MTLASNRKTCFAESRVRRIVDKNLESLLWTCLSWDDSVARRHVIVLNYAIVGLPFVQQRVADAVLSRMEDLVDPDIDTNLWRIKDCVETLTLVLRSMSKPQRQKWVRLMVKFLMLRDVPTAPVIWRLNMLWLADDNPRETYAEARQQLQTLEQSA